MSRNQFRSQPTLQRTGGGGGFGGLLVSFAALAGAGALGAFAMSHFGDQGPSTLAEAPAPAPSDVQMALADAATPLPAPVAPLPAAPAATAPTLVAAAAQPAPTLAEAARAKRPVKKRPATPQYEMAASADDAAVTATALERQQRDYAAAMERYEKAEREEGYRWAKQNRVRVVRYCRTTAQRTEAFMKGCLAYVGRTAKASDEDASRVTASPAKEPEEG